MRQAAKGKAAADAAQREVQMHERERRMQEDMNVRVAEAQRQLRIAQDAMKQVVKTSDAEKQVCAQLEPLHFSSPLRLTQNTRVPLPHANANKCRRATLSRS